MRERLQPVLAVLDEGLNLYRRHFVPFLLLSAGWVVPFAMLYGVLFGISLNMSSSSEDALAMLLLLGGMFLLLPWLLYLLGGMSRAAAAAIDGRPVRIRESLSIAPKRALGMGCFTLVYMMVAQFVASLFSLFILCPLYFVLIFGVVAFASVTSSPTITGIMSLGLVIVLFGGVYLFILVISGASYSSVLYAMQPWVQETLGFGDTIQRTVDLLIYRFAGNLLAWCFSALALTAVGVTVTFTVGIVLPLPILYFLGADTPLAQALSIASLVLGLVVTIPPLPIWMALLYRRNAAARAGADLDARVQSWWQKHFSV
jgi:hypothetical protein